MFNLRHSRKNLLLLLSVILGAQSCINKEDFDFNELAGVKAGPSVAVPLLYGKLSIEDLLPKDSLAFVQPDKDGLIHVVFNDTLRSASIHDLFLLPQLNHSEEYPVLLNVLNPDGKQVVVEDRELLNFKFGDADFETIKLKEGKATVKGGSSLDSPVDLTVTFPTLTKDGSPLVIKLVLSPGSLFKKATTEEDLAGYKVDFSSFGTGENFLPVEIKAETENSGGSAQDFQSLISFDLLINGLKFSLITGDFGQPEVQLPSGEIPIEIFEKLFSKGKFELKEPLISFNILNSNGIPLRVFANTLQAGNSQNEILDLQTNPALPFDIQYPSVIGETALTTLQVSNSKEVLDMAPSFITYGLSGRLNPAPATELNFITDRSEIAVVLNADFPLWGYVEGISLSDTMPLNLTDLEKTEMNNASLRLVIENEFPLEGQLQIEFVNGNHDVLETLFTGDFESVLPASTVNSNGELASPGKYSKDIEISPEKFDRILKAQKMIIRANLLTSRGPDGTFPHVKIKSGYKLNVNLGVKTTADINVKF